MKQIITIALALSFLGLKAQRIPSDQNLPKGDQLYFTPNLGQWGEADNSIAKAIVPGGIVYVTENGIRIITSHPNDIASKHKAFHYKSKDTQFVYRYHVSHIGFSNGAKPQKIDFQFPAPFYENYYFGSDPEQWKNMVQPVERILLKNIYPKIDVAVYFNLSQLEFDWILHPGSDPNNIELLIDSTTKITLVKNSIVAKTSVGQFIIHAPKASQLNRMSSKFKSITCKYVIEDENKIKLQIGRFDTATVLTIDPILVFSTYSGSLGDNFGFTATYDTAGCLYAGGIVEADTRLYPVTPGAFQTVYGGGGGGAPPVQLPCDISISKYSSDGTKLLYATYMGGDDDEYPHSLCVDPQNNLLIFGTTLSTNFPVHPDSAFNKIHQGDYDIFVNKLSVDGTKLLGGTFVGGTDADGFQTEIPFTSLLYNYADNYRGDVTTDPKGNIYIATCTRSTNFPTTTSAFQIKPKGVTDAAILSLNSQLSAIRWSTLVGGSKDDAAYSVKVDDSLHVFIGGGTNSNDMPIIGNGFLKSAPGNIDGFILRMDQSSGKYQVGTFWGSSAYDQIYFIDLDINNKVYFTGQTEGKIKRSASTYGKDNTTQFIGRFSNDLSTEELVTTFGNRTNGIPELSPSAFMVDNCYNIYFSGWGSSIGIGNSGTTNGLPITADAHQKTTDRNDFYLIVLGKDAKALKYASYFGGNQSKDHVDGGTSRFDNRGIIYQSVCASCPNSPPGLNDFPTSPANVVFKNNVSIRCSNASFKLDFRLGYAIDAIFYANPQQICLNKTVHFVPQNKHNAKYQWNFGDGDTSQSFSPKHLYRDTGTYTVILTVTDSNSCNSQATYSLLIKVLTIPTGTWNHFINECEPGVNFTMDVRNADSIKWNFGDGYPVQTTAATPRKFTKNYQYATGEYQASAILYNHKTGCTDTLKSKVLAITDSTHAIKVANVFTPNNDGKNDCWRIYGISEPCEKAELRIYNRWGERIFFTKDLSQCWNGMVNNSGPQLPEGTYFYQLDVLESRYIQTPKLYSGTINLLRGQ